MLDNGLLKCLNIVMGYNMIFLTLGELLMPRKDHDLTI